MFRDICLSMLSDDDFTLEECEDLREKVKDGILTKFTVVELERRARILHEDITKHWIARKLSLLPKLIGHAHEKGWRDKLSDYMKEKKHLEEPSVQSALLQKFPTVTPDVVEFDPLADYKSHDKQEHQCLSETTPSKVVIAEHEDGETCSEKKEQQYHACSPEEKDEFNTLEEPHQFTIIDPNKSKTFLVQEISKCKVVCQSEANISIGDAKENQLLGNRLGPVEVESKEQERVEVIDLSSDEEAELGFAIEDPDKCIWHVSGHIGNGKYSLSLLERWAKKCPSAQNFKVWKEGQSEEKAIRLSKVINLALPRK